MLRVGLPCLSYKYLRSHSHSQVDNQHGYEHYCNSSPISTSSSRSMSIASMATTPITPDSGVSFNGMDLSVHNQGQGLCAWSHGVVPVPAASSVQGQTQFRTLGLASEYDFDTGTGMDMDTTLDIFRVPRNDQDLSVTSLGLGMESQQDDMNLRLVEIMERTEGLAVVSPVREEGNMERVEDHFERDE
jgi:hypothetical protein